MQIRQEPMRLREEARVSLPGAKGWNSGALIFVKTAFCRV
jgi:hypothetical protein